MNTLRDFITQDMFIKLHAIGRAGDKSLKLKHLNSI